MSGDARREPLASWDCESGRWLAASGMSSDLFGQSEPFSGRWPTSGMTRSGSLYPLPMSAPRTNGSACSSLLPTPSAGNFNDGESLESWEARRQENLAKGINGNGQGTPLTVAVQLLRTPTAQLAVNGGSQHPDKRRDGGHGPTLADEVEHLLPTPNATDGKGSAGTKGRERAGRPRKAGDANLPEALELLPTPRAADGNGNGRAARGREGSPSLADRLLPTPRASDGTKGGPNQRGSSGDLMLPSAVLLLPTPRASDGPGGSAHNRTWSTTDRSLHTLVHTGELGEPTNQPSAAGKPPSDGQHPGQLSLDGLEND